MPSRGIHTLSGTMGRHTYSAHQFAARYAARTRQEQFQRIVDPIECLLPYVPPPHLETSYPQRVIPPSH